MGKTSWEFIKRNGTTPIDLYFISVKGGFRPLQQQFNLLKQMEKISKAYRVSFVVSSSELGEDDPLMQNVTQHLSSLRVPWYNTCTTKASEGHGVGCFQEKITISNGKTLEIIGVNTELLKDSAAKGSLSGNRNSRLSWLIRTLEASNSDWRMVVGNQPLIVCGDNKEKSEKTQAFEYLHRIFLKFAVNVYLSGQDCTHLVHEGSVAHIGNPGFIENDPYSVFLNKTSVFSRELANGFLLHRVTSLQIVTYYITSSGEIVYKTVIQQKGREII
ncbi:hypothetical protein L6164_014212 [Bauhinia variegata]|uniref:Uncharacterized protein n=1 Tax=Bauhinia variegata TaxID=167791 RepID=A0ACB9NGJ7_BAUVA|nr:hypothetical protein L6164_014212 [Bauhinia variegata]